MHSPLPAIPAPGTAYATLAGGCFWCIEAAFNQLRGVIQAESGYANGQHPSPTYDDICQGDTGHAEVVRIQFDPTQISYSQLLDVFFMLHDPTTLNRQGNDVGTQYRSGIYTHDASQAHDAAAKIAALTAEQVFADPIVTEVCPVSNYHCAEAYHQGYAVAHPQQGYCAYVVAPKLAKFRQTWAQWLKPGA